jgi:hypothetical protein
MLTPKQRENYGYLQNLRGCSGGFVFGKILRANTAHTHTQPYSSSVADVVNMYCRLDNMYASNIPQNLFTATTSKCLLALLI